jgi:hypothetical protein
MNLPALLCCGLLLGSDPNVEKKMPVQVRLDARQELVWNGSFVEESFRANNKTRRTYDFEARLLVLKQETTGTQFALLTTLRSTDIPAKTDTPQASVSRLELLHVDPAGVVKRLNPIAWLEQGKTELRPLPQSVIEGLPTQEFGMFLPVPAKGVSEGSAWDIAETNRPYRSFQVQGIEQPRGACCFQLVSEQETDDWALGSSRGYSYRTREDLLLSQCAGLVCKMNRTVEVRDPNSTELSFRSQLTYEQNQRSRLTGEGFRERYEEIRQIVWTQAVLEQLAPRIGRDPKAFEGVVNLLGTYEANYRDREELPYRPALLQLKERTELAVRGQIPPDPGQSQPSNLTRTGLRLNEPAPDFLVSELSGSETLRLKRLRNRPVLLIYLKPETVEFLLMIEASEQLLEKHGDKLRVVPLVAKTGEVRVNPKLPLFDGLPAFERHQIQRTPKTVLLDKDGVVRFTLDGWGSDSKAKIEQELERWGR